MIIFIIILIIVVINSPVEGYIIKYSNDIPLVDYGKVDGVYIGLQTNPVTISNAALALYNDSNSTAMNIFLKDANWIVKHSVSRGNYSVLLYNFPWGIYNLDKGWISGMAHGLALQVLIKAHEFTGNEKYLHTAKNLLNSFFISVKNGGVAYKDQSGGFWYDEYASNKSQVKVSRVLNGMMFTVLGIYDYWNYTKSPNAKFLFDKGIVSLKNDLPRYDNNGVSYYDRLGNPAHSTYHQIHIDLARKLYNITGEPVFKEYSDKWDNRK